MAYDVRAYYDGDLRGLADRRICSTQDDMIDTVHELCCFQGNFVKIVNNETGASLVFDPDTWMECIDYGDVPESIKKL